VITVKTTVIGSAELRERFLRVGDDVRNRLRRAMLALAEEVRSDAAGNAPRKTGKLASSIKVKLAETDTQMKVTVAPGKFYGRFQEFGLNTVRKPPRTRGVVGVRTRTTKTGTVLVSARRGFLASQGGATHPFRLPAHPFMGPAIDRVQGKIEGALDSALSQGVAEGG
jgi:HK97 gp10 family phage protein